MSGDGTIAVSNRLWGAKSARGGVVVVEVFEWCVTVSCPVESLSGGEALGQSAKFKRRLYVWTPGMCASDAYDEVLRIISGWPPDTRIVAIALAGVYRWLECAERQPSPVVSSMSSMSAADAT